MYIYDYTKAQIYLWRRLNQTCLCKFNTEPQIHANVLLNQKDTCLCMFTTKPHIHVNVRLMTLIPQRVIHKFIYMYVDIHYERITQTSLPEQRISLAFRVLMRETCPYP